MTRIRARTESDGFEPSKIFPFTTAAMRHQIIRSRRAIAFAQEVRRFVSDFRKPAEVVPILSLSRPRVYFLNGSLKLHCAVTGPFGAFQSYVIFTNGAARSPFHSQSETFPRSHRPEIKPVADARVRVFVRRCIRTQSSPSARNTCACTRTCTCSGRRVRLRCTDQRLPRYVTCARLLRSPPRPYETKKRAVERDPKVESIEREMACAAVSPK